MWSLTRIVSQGDFEGAVAGRSDSSSRANVSDHEQPRETSGLACPDRRPYTSDMPLDRNDQEERLARIEQMIEDLRREVIRFNDFHQKTVEDLLRPQPKRAREVLSKTRRPSSARP